jgi:hypothetical protein
VDVELRRAAGATLGKNLSITWQNGIQYFEGGLGRRRLRGG